MRNNLEYFKRFGLHVGNGNLTIITGSSGSGKSLVVIRMIEHLNHHQNAIIINSEESTNSFLNKIIYLSEVRKEKTFEILKFKKEILEMKNKNGANIKYINSRDFKDGLYLTKKENGAFDFNNYTFIIDGFECIDKESIINWRKFNVLKRVLLTEKIYKEKNIKKMTLRKFSERNEINVIENMIQSLRVFSHSNNAQLILIKSSYQTQLNIHNLPKPFLYLADNIVATERNEININIVDNNVAIDRNRINEQNPNVEPFQLRVLKSRY